MNCRRQGMSLIELMVVLVLMGMFAALANPVLRWSIRTLATPPPTAAATRLDNAIGAMRRDVWGAAALAAPSAHELTVTALDGHSITWHVGPGNVLRRDDHPWDVAFPDGSLAVDGAAVRLTFPAGSNFRGGGITLASEAMLIGRGS